MVKGVFRGRQADNQEVQSMHAENEQLKQLVAELSIDVLTIDFENAFVTSYEKNIPAENFSRDFDVRPGKSYPKDVVVYHLPFIGDKQLLRLSPSKRLLWTIPVYLTDSCLCFEIIAFRENPKDIERDANSNIGNIKNQGGNLVKEVTEYNSNLRQKIKEVFYSRKQKILKKSDMLAALSVPVRKRDNVPETFVVPTQKTRKSISPKPVVKEKGFKPDPTLDKLMYIDILKTINDVGKSMERLPATYSEKDEEDLRDHFLLFLEAGYEGSATGETFNKKGKTDILMRHENSNLFIAECKFWRGKIQYLAAISQLLNYLTWRDSKAAVILFVRNKDFSSVLEIVKDVTPTHENHLGFVNAMEDSWLNYRFHIVGDINREVKLAVLLFHIPS